LVSDDESGTVYLTNVSAKMSDKGILDVIDVMEDKEDVYDPRIFAFRCLMATLIACKDANEIMAALRGSPITFEEVNFIASKWFDSIIEFFTGHEIHNESRGVMNMLLRPLSAPYSIPVHNPQSCSS